MRVCQFRHIRGRLARIAEPASAAGAVQLFAPRFRYVRNTLSQYGALMPKPPVSSWKWWRMWSSRRSFPHARLGVVVVQVVVDLVVDHVAREKARREGVGRGRAHDQDERDDEPGGQRHADRRRHHEAHRVVGVVVVHAVDDPVEPRAEAVLGLEVEDDPVDPVLAQGPEGVAAGPQASSGSTPRSWVSASTTNTITAGTNRSTGTIGWTRESLSRRSFSNIRGEARRSSVRRISALLDSIGADGSRGGRLKELRRARARVPTMPPHIRVREAGRCAGARAKETRPGRRLAVQLERLRTWPAFLAIALAGASAVILSNPMPQQSHKRLVGRIVHACPRGTTRVVEAAGERDRDAADEHVLHHRRPPARRLGDQRGAL